MLTKVLVYAYCVGVFSSRKIRQRLIEDAAFRALDRRQCAGPSHDRRLRKRRLWALKISSSRYWAWLANWGATCVGRVAREGQDRSERLENEAIRYDRTQDVRRISSVRGRPNARSQTPTVTKHPPFRLPARFLSMLRRLSYGNQDSPRNCPRHSRRSQLACGGVALRGTFGAGCAKRRAAMWA